MAGEITQEQVEAMLRPFENSDKGTENVSVNLPLAQFKAIASAALLALRQQQDGMVLVRRGLINDAAECIHALGIGRGGWAWEEVAEELDNVWLAASGQGQTEAAAAQEVSAGKGNTSDSPSVASPIPASAAALNAARLEGIALGVEAAAELMNAIGESDWADDILALSISDIAAKNPTEAK